MFCAAEQEARRDGDAAAEASMSVDVTQDDGDNSHPQGGSNGEGGWSGWRDGERK